MDIIIFKFKLDLFFEYILPTFIILSCVLVILIWWIIDKIKENKKGKK